MRRALILLLVTAAPLAAQTPATVPERTNYQRTSTTAEVGAFLDSLQTMGAPITLGTMGHSAGGKPLYLVIASEPRITSPAEAAASGKLVVYLQANIHGGEVEGKEAVQQILRELMGPRRSLLEKLIILVAPVYNADGNDALGPQERNRSEQNGPPLVGQRPDGLNLDLNRDYLKAEAPETQASLAAIYDTWDPALMMDLHTTDGTLHGYLLTYSPPLDPNGPGGPTAFVRDSLLPSVRKTLQDRHHEPVFDYGNVENPMEPKAWTTYAPLGWYGTNYVGLRGRMAVLSEAYSHADFATRVRVTHDFTVAILEYAAAHAGEIRDIERAADRQTTLEGTATVRPALAVEYQPASRGSNEPIPLEIVRPTGDTGVEGPRYQGTGKLHTVSLPVYDRFRAKETRPLPAGYFLPASLRGIVDKLRLHGIQVQQLRQALTDTVEAVHPDSLRWSPREFQGHHLLSIRASYAREARTFPAGTWYVPTGQPLGRLVFTLLEPEGYGLWAWGDFDRMLGSEVGALSGLVYGSSRVGELPIWRALREPKSVMRTE